MTEIILPPAVNPCGSCPYRRDVPSGVWADEEYAKLPPYDEPTYAQPFSVFMCHQQNGRLCAGWVACHDMTQNAGLRVAISRGMIAPENVRPIYDYKTPVEIFLSGAEAAEHGRAEIESPGEKARKVIDKVITKTGALHD